MTFKIQASSPGVLQVYQKAKQKIAKLIQKEEERYKISCNLGQPNDQTIGGPLNLHT